MKRLSGGIDVGSEEHQVVVLDETNTVVYDRTVAHRYEAFRQMEEEVRAIERTRGCRLEFAMEGKSGYAAPFDRFLLKAGFTVYNIDNLALKRFRGAFPGEWRDDERDALMLATLMGLKGHLNGKEEKAFVPIRRAPIVHEQLKVVTRHQEMLIKEKVRFQHRLKKKIAEICPGFLDLGHLDKKSLLRLLRTYPDFSYYHKLNVEALRAIPGIGPITAGNLNGRIRSFEYDRELVTSYSLVIQSLATHILSLKAEIESLNEDLEALGSESPQVQLLLSIPGVGTLLSCRLISELGTIQRFNSSAQLAIYCGVGCVKNASGKRHITRAVFKANKICKTTMIEIAGCTIRYVEESKRYYQHKRAEGKGHNHALRCLARQLIKVIFRMLKEERSYSVSSLATR